MSTDSQIDSIRRGLGLTPEEEALVHAAAPWLQPHVELLIDAFYARLVTDDVAMALLKDEATVIRLKRSLSAWLHEMLTLPYDAAYERTRADIGRTHLRIGMPQHLMVTSMGCLRRDVADAVERHFADEPGKARSVARAIEKVLDLELALMLGVYRRKERELEQLADHVRSEREIQAQYASAVADATDAASCYAALVRRTDEPDARRRWLDRLDVALRAVATPPERLSAEPAEAGTGSEESPPNGGSPGAATDGRGGRDANRPAAR